MLRRKRILQGLMVIFLGLLALGMTEAKASPTFCDEYVCVPASECNEGLIITFCNNACPGWVWGECGQWDPWCWGSSRYYICATTPE